MNEPHVRYLEIRHHSYKDLTRLGLDLIPRFFPSAALTSKNTLGGIFLTRHKKRTNPVDMTTFQELLQISPDIFEEFVLDDVVSKKVCPSQRERCNQTEKYHWINIEQVRNR